MAGVVAGCGDRSMLADPTESPQSEQRIAFGHSADRSVHQQSLSSYQHRILQKGFVTWSDYAGSVDRTVQCMRSDGLVVDGPQRSVGQRFLDYGYSVTGATEKEALLAQAAAAVVADNCYAQYESAVRDAWTEQSTLSEEARATQFEQFGGCLKSAGLPVNENSSADQLATAVENSLGDDDADAGTVRDDTGVGPNPSPVESCVRLHMELLSTAEPLGG